MKTNPTLLSFILAAMTAGMPASRILIEAECETGEPRDTILHHIKEAQQS